MANSKARSASSVLMNIFKECGIEKDFENYLAARSFKDIAGDIIYSQCEKIEFNNGILKLKVPSPSWRQELLYLKPQIIKKYNNHFKKKIVYDIKFY